MRAMGVRRAVEAAAWSLLPAYLRRQRGKLDLASALQFFFFQRILGVNRHVGWPVHWTSTVPSRHDKRFVCGADRCPGLSPGVRIQAFNGVTLGRNVWVGPGVQIISANHDIEDHGRHIPASPIIIGDDCWLGANAIILPGVRLGNHVVVAAGAVVTKSFPQDNTLLAGVPARAIKQLGPYQGGRSGIGD